MMQVKMNRQQTNESIKTSDELTHVEGYAIVFNSFSRLMKDKQTGRIFREIIPRNAKIEFTPDVIVDFAHEDATQILGRTSENTLKIKRDDKGVWFSCEPYEGHTILKDVNHGNYKNASFTAYPRNKIWRYDNVEKHWICIIDDMLVDSLSIVGRRPGYEDTVVIAREVDEEKEAQEDVETLTDEQINDIKKSQQQQEQQEEEQREEQEQAKELERVRIAKAEKDKFTFLNESDI